MNKFSIIKNFLDIDLLIQSDDFSIIYLSYFDVSKLFSRTKIPYFAKISKLYFIFFILFKLGPKNTKLFQ